MTDMSLLTLGTLVGKARLADPAFQNWLVGGDALGLSPNDACVMWETVMVAAGTPITPVAAALLGWATPLAGHLKGHVAIALEVDAWVRERLDAVRFDRISRRHITALREDVSHIDDEQELALIDADARAAYRDATLYFELGDLPFYVIIDSMLSDRRYFHLYVPGLADDGSSQIAGSVPDDFGQEGPDGNGDIIPTPAPATPAMPVIA